MVRPEAIGAFAVWSCQSVVKVRGLSGGPRPPASGTDPPSALLKDETHLLQVRTPLLRTRTPLPVIRGLTWQWATREAGQLICNVIRSYPGRIGLTDRSLLALYQGHREFPFWKSKIPPRLVQKFPKIPVMKILPIHPVCKPKFITIVIYLPISN